MATILDPSPRAYTPPRPGTVHHVLAAITDLKRLGLDHLELATAEAQRAARAWNAIVAAIVLVMVDRDISWTVSLIVAAVLHLAAAGAVVFWMRTRVPEMVFAATVRQLRADAGETP